MTVKIPAGVASGMKLRVSGKGKPSAQGGTNGDLFVILNIEEHDMFQRVDNELLAELNISMVDACLGTEMNFESLDGQVLVTVELHRYQHLTIKTLKVHLGTKAGIDHANV